MNQTLSCQILPMVPFAEAVGYTRLAEELGYDSVLCSHIAARDSFTLLAGLATHTERIHLGTAVAPIYHRSPASMAQTAATLDELSDGRFRLGLGTGHRVTMGGWHGQDIGRPVPEMREYLAIVRAILAGEPPPEGQRWRSTFAFMGFTPRADIPIHLAGLSPAMLRLAGEHADGVLLWATPADYVRDVVVPEVTTGRRRAGKDLDGFAIGAAIPAAVGTDRSVMLDGVRTELHRYFGLPFYRAMFETAGYGKDLAAYDAAAPDREAQKQAISEEFIDSLCALGDVADVQRGIERYRTAGATNPVITGVVGTDYSATLRAAATGSI
ncbi:LLM class flavin-dependent oxidoreductase [Pseudonocardia spinosispora]|uniref:LLM class flavin-dependent oxidoreductase n=1 Tax=Pseudonocardia spinosispora TaxID=103441 RepID=UPI00041170A9|nr:LLM class flavin-dependent oxidoreductase [Pseudonocardia spinosispora]